MCPAPNLTVQNGLIWKEMAPPQELDTISQKREPASVPAGQEIPETGVILELQKAKAPRITWRCGSIMERIQPMVLTAMFFFLKREKKKLKTTQKRLR